MPPKKALPCAVRGCIKYWTDIRTITRHRFPLEMQVTAAWVRFLQDPSVEDRLRQAGPIGVRSLFICSRHFKPSCYKVPETKTTLKNDAVPTLNGPSDTSEVSRDDGTDEGVQVTSEHARFGPTEDGPSLRVYNHTDHLQTKYRRASDRFYDFLLDDEDDGDDDDETAFNCRKRCKKNIPEQNVGLCICHNCRKERAARIMSTAAPSNKFTQTEDRGPQPVASPLPTGQRDSCRLCFSADQLEPLCSGMIVVRDELLDKIYACTGIMIIPRPKESIFVCTQCVKLITSFYSYRQQVCSNNCALLHMTSKETLATVSPDNKRKIPLSVGSRITKRAKPNQKDAVPLPQTDMLSAEDQLHMIQPEISIVPPFEIKTETEDPLAGYEEPELKVLASTLPATEVLLAVEMEQSMQTEPSSETDLLMEAEEGQEDDHWSCWQCGTSFLFQFECAKHLLQVHNESVAFITERLKLNELNANMLEMMSVHQRK